VQALKSDCDGSNQDNAPHKKQWFAVAPSQTVAKGVSILLHTHHVDQSISRVSKPNGQANQDSMNQGILHPESSIYHSLPAGCEQGGIQSQAIRYPKTNWKYWFPVAS